MQAITLPVADTAIAQQLGAPSVQFALPNPWLDNLAKRATEEQK
jgi:hypothetical protein